MTIENGRPRLEGHSGPVTINGERMGVFPNHIAALWALRHSQATAKADAFLILEDDVALPRGLKKYLDRVLWPEDETQIGAIMLFTHKYFAKINPGWHQWTPDVYHSLWGAQALIFSPYGIDAWLRSPLHCLHRETENASLNAFADTELTKFCSVYKRSLWFAVGRNGESLAAHLGTESSVFGPGPGSMPGRNEKAYAGKVISAPTYTEPTTKTAVQPNGITGAKILLSETMEQRATRRLSRCEECVHWVDEIDAVDRQFPQGCDRCATPGIKPTLLNIGTIGPKCKRGYWV